tara:strand:+ start:533 stop:754 length:222 start_codon:yes stop_codon:yes gene_type:complete
MSKTTKIILAISVALLITLFVLILKSLGGGPPRGTKIGPLAEKISTGIKFKKEFLSSIFQWFKSGTIYCPENL